MCAICTAMVVVLSGCFLSHLRDREPAGVDMGFPAGDLGPAVRDLGPGVVDAGTIDASIVVSDCTAFWTGLPWCPANTDAAVGQSCDQEGVRCSDACCPAGSPIGCRGGVWEMLDVDPECSGVFCASPTPCGTGACALGQICVRTEGLRGGDDTGGSRCVELPTPIDSCGGAPAGSIVEDVRACMTCSCNVVDGAVQISLECACC